MIFYDTGAWVGLSVANDRNAPAARKLHSETSRGAHGSIVTSDFVLDEAATLIRMSADVETAARFLRGVMDGTATLIWIDPEHFRNALALLEKHRDKRWSFTDCTSFVVMRELGIDRAFSFDRNYEQAGFTRLPRT
ncbi:MAG TPA: PIN domain-containing protein [Thermoplasmata archaeon]|nr:PIN domain-containing protein [Thermoplasmata archaeon]